MPPRWPRKPDRKNDPAFRRLDDRMTFATHVALTLASNSGLWFVRLLKQADSWTWVPWFTGIWLVVLALHGVYIFAIADYSNPTPQQTPD
ncbi:MAG: 2TM domain-containing protein [Cyanothece sp. SIO2G6]|nr:2TM domain-containing protein [Cyanothece sp. SIO2G6]